MKTEMIIGIVFLLLAGIIISIAYTSDQNYFNSITNFTGNLTDGKYCTYDSNNNLINCTSDAGSDGSSLWNESGSNIYYNEGNVGIGTTSPQVLLDINTESAESTILRIDGESRQRKEIQIRNYAASELSANKYLNYVGSIAGTTGVLGGYDNTGTDVPVIYWGINGYVGIGTPAPQTILEIEHDLPLIRFDRGQQWRFGIDNGTYANGDDIIFYDEQASTVRMVLTDSGEIGIGTTTPQNKLDVEGEAVIGSTYSGTNTAPTNGLLVEGNVGIGTTTPTEKLDVDGIIKTIPRSSATCDSDAEGGIYYDSDDNTFYGCNSTSWVALS